MSRRTFSYGLGIADDDDNEEEYKENLFREKRQRVQIYDVNNSSNNRQRVVNAAFTSQAGPTSFGGLSLTTLGRVEGASAAGAYNYEVPAPFPNFDNSYGTGVHITDMGGHGFQQSFTATVTPETPMNDLQHPPENPPNNNPEPMYRCSTMQYHYAFSAHTRHDYAAAHADMLNDNADVFQLQNGDVLATTLALSTLNNKLKREKDETGNIIKKHRSAESILELYRPFGVIENTTPTQRDTAELIAVAEGTVVNDINMFKTTKIVTTGAVYMYNIFTEYDQNVPKDLEDVELVSGSMDGAYCFFLLTPIMNESKKFLHYMFLPFAVRNTLGLEHDMATKFDSAGEEYKSRLVYVGQTSLCIGDNTLSGPKILDILCEDFTSNSTTPLVMHSKTTMNRTILQSKDFMDKININLSLYNQLDYIP